MKSAQKPVTCHPSGRNLDSQAFTLMQKTVGDPPATISHLNFSERTLIFISYLLLPYMEPHSQAPKVDPDEFWQTTLSSFPLPVNDLGMSMN